MILITGATGSIGRPLIKKLLAQGAAFRALVRDDEKGKALGCDYVVGDLDDPETLSTAFTGVERVFLNTGFSRDMVKQKIAAIDASKRAGVTSIVNISVPGASANTKSGMGGGHGAIEAHIEASGIGWTMLRPMFFMQNFFGHADSIRNEGKIFGAYREGRIAFIDVQDIAAAAATLLVGTHGGGESFVLTGSEALTHGEVAQRFAAQLGKPVTYVDLPVDEIIAHMVADGMPAEFVRNLGGMMSAMAEGGAAHITDTVLRLTNQPARTFDQFIASNLTAFQLASGSAPLR